MVGPMGCAAKHTALASSTDPNAAWVQQKAVACQGDFRKLAPEDQKKLVDLYGFPGAPSRIANVYNQSKGQ